MQVPLFCKWASSDNLELKRRANPCKQAAFAAGVQGKPKRCRALIVEHLKQSKDLRFDSNNHSI